MELAHLRRPAEVRARSRCHGVEHRARLELRAEHVHRLLQRPVPAWHHVWLPVLHSLHFCKFVYKSFLFSLSQVDEGAGTYTKKIDFWTSGHYSKFVRRGAVRVEVRPEGELVHPLSGEWSRWGGQGAGGRGIPQPRQQRGGRRPQQQVMWRLWL